MDVLGELETQLASVGNKNESYLEVRQLLGGKILAQRRSNSTMRAQICV